MSKLLLTSRISSGTSVIRREPLELPALAGKVVRRLRALTSIHSFEVSFAPDFPPVLADPELIEEVLTNLVENAIKYSPGGGRVTISGNYDDKKVAVTVSDEGIGIPAEEIAHIFKRFYRVDKGPARSIKGLGLGLYLCKMIIEAHGGRIDVSSQLGRGSQFVFTLPVQQDA